MQDVSVSRPSTTVAVIALHGEHDVLTHDRFEQLLATEIGTNALVVVDVTEATFVDSSFIHNLVKANRLARSHGSRFVLQMGTARIVRSAIEIAGILNSLEWAGSREEALWTTRQATEPL